MADRLAELRDMPPERIDYPDRKETEFAAGEEDGGLLKPPAFSPLRYARQKKVEFLIWGEIQQVEGYLYLEVAALNAPLEKQVFTYQDAVRPEELYAVLEGVTDELAALLLGRAWSTLSLSSLSPDCGVWLDGRYHGKGPGTSSAISSRGRAPCASSALTAAKGRPGVALLPGEVLEFSPDLRPVPVRTVRIESDPPGARVYAGSRYLGLTPLEMDSPGAGPGSCCGWKAMARPLSTWTRTALAGMSRRAPGSARSCCRPAWTRPAPRSGCAGRFYRSFGLWAMSLPIPFPALRPGGGLFDGRAGGGPIRRPRRGRAPSFEGHDGLVRLPGGLGLSAALFVNMGLKSEGLHRGGGPEGRLVTEIVMQAKKSLACQAQGPVRAGRLGREPSMEELEDALIEGDLGPAVASEVVQALEENVPAEAARLPGGDPCRPEGIAPGLPPGGPLVPEKGRLNVFLVLGVNGVGKTTTIAKLAEYLRRGKAGRASC
jgi:hypothetical protein